MKKYIPLNIKIFIVNLKFIFLNWIPDILFLKKNKNKDKIILLEVPTYSNLGDQAISYAEKVFFKDRFPEKVLYEVTGYRYKWYEKWLLKYTDKKDLFVIIGGGNFGNQYKEIEDRRLRILNYFKERPIISFPQTLYYTSDREGTNAKQEMKEAIAKNFRAVFFMREQVSNELFKKYFSKQAILVPDIVLYLEKNTYNKRENQILLCMRDDCEQNNNLREKLINCTKKYFENVIETDTCTNYSINRKVIDDILERKWKEFQNSKLVITDRLHGMIFALITGTPCIVLPNYNHKITSFYDTWLKDVPYIHYADSINDIIKIMMTIDLKSTYYYDKKIFEEYFNIMENTIREVLDEFKE